MRPRVNNSAAVLQRRQAQLRGPTSNNNSSSFHQRNSKDGYDEGLLGNGGGIAGASSANVLYSHHFPAPNIPMDGALTFEIIMFTYSMVAMCLQLLHLYRSVFWLPHSYNRNAVNWYLIEWHLLTFVSVFLGRRIFWHILKTFIYWLVPSHWCQSFIIVARSLTTVAVLAALFLIIYFTMIKYPILNLLYLAYPVFVYFLLFGFAGAPYLELTPNTSYGKMRVYKDKSGMYRTSYSLPGNPPIPDSVRMESNLLRADFNMRMKQVAFNSICSAYYATFVPCIFTQSALHYDLNFVGRHVILVFIGCFTLYSIQCFPGCYIHLMHRCACSLGGWTKIEGRISPNFYAPWSSANFWPRGCIVRHGKDLFKAEGLTNAAEPNDAKQAKFYSLFRNVSFFSWIFLIVQAGLVLAQHVSLTISAQWYMLISEALLLFANYYGLFKVTRDYMVFMKVNAVEQEWLQVLNDEK